MRAGAQASDPLTGGLVGALIWSDLVHSAALWGMPRRHAILAAAVKLALYPRVRAIAWFRVSQWLWRRRAARPLALLVQAHVLRMSGAEIHPAAAIGPGLSLAHSAGIVIGARTCIGPRRPHLPAGHPR